MDDFKAQVKRSFSLCKADIEELKKENSELKEALKKQQEMIYELKAEIKGLKIALEILKSTPKEKKEAQKEKKDTYTEILNFKARINRKDMLKKKMLALIREKISLSELKYLFVDHHKYTSKATFYNYLRELEYEHAIEIKRENNKNIVYAKKIEILEKEDV